MFAQIKSDQSYPGFPLLPFSSTWRPSFFQFDPVPDPESRSLISRLLQEDFFPAFTTFIHKDQTAMTCFILDIPPALAYTPPEFSPIQAPRPLDCFSAQGVLKNPAIFKEIGF